MAKKIEENLKKRMINVDLRSLKNNEKEELIKAPLGDPLGIRIFFFISLIINLFK